MPVYHRPPARGRAIHNDQLFAFLQPAWRVRYGGSRPAFVRALATYLGADHRIIQRRFINTATNMCRPRVSEINAMAALLGIDRTLLLALAEVIDDTAVSTDTDAAALDASAEAVSA